jgi:NTE family protein
MRSLLTALAVAFGMSGCATHFENHPLAAGQANPERRSVDVSQQDRPLILVAISGGGSRAAAMGWVVLRELRKYSYTTASGASRPLIDDIAVISSVSGGSVIAAHFALEGPQGLDRFEPDFLALDNTRTLGAEALSPLRLVTGASRSDLVEKLFDRQLFAHKTFAALNQPGKPYLILNATDMASGEVFAFTPQRFDDICSDLDAQAISTGVAASAAVPVAFTPIAFTNYNYGDATGYCRQRPIPIWVTNRLDPVKGRFAPYLNVDQFKLARYTNDLRNGPGQFRKIQYLYFMDGGLADNLAIHGLMETAASPFGAPVVAPAPGQAGPPTTILRAINDGRVRKLAVIMVNSRADPANDIYTTPQRPGIIGMIGSVTSLPIDSASAGVKNQMDALLEQYKGFPGAPAIYDIELDFDQLRGSDPVQHALRDQAKQIPTLWTISKSNLDVIDKVGSLLLQQHPCFQRLLSDLAIPAGFINADYARKGCAQTTDQP